MLRDFFTTAVVAATIVTTTVVPSSAGNGHAPLNRRERLLSVGMKLVALDPPRGGDLTSPSPGMIWSDTVQHSANTSVAVHIKVAAPAHAPGWKIKVRDVNRRPVEELPSTEPCWSIGGCWTRRVPRGEVNIQLWSDGGVDGMQVKLDAYAFTTLPSDAEATVGEDDKKDISAAPTWIQQLAPSIARLVIINQRSYCTGFLVSADLLLTNQHCIADDADALSTIAEFKYEKPRAAPERSYRVRKLEVNDPDLDYAVVRLDGNAAARYGRLRIVPDATTANGTALAVIQHPAGWPKMFVEKDCVMNGTDVTGAGSAQTDFGHTCDTLQGSSGSPVFVNPTGAVIGLHHWGFDESAKPLNQAVHFDRILKHIRDEKHLPGLAGEMVAP